MRMNLRRALQECQKANVSGVLQQVAPGGTITGTGAPFPPTGYSSYQAPEEEGEPVRYVQHYLRLPAYPILYPFNHFIY